MTSPPSPPNRRGRRIVIAVAVLLLVSLVSWWYWPRGDARFVGKWQYRFVGTVGGRTPPDGPGMTVWDMRSNGIAVLSSIGRSGNFPTTYARWSVEDASLILRLKNRSGTYKIRSVEANEIDLEDVKLVRLSE